MQEAIVKSKNGIHARPASMIASLANQYSGEIALIKGEKSYNAKSMMSIMSMGLQDNDLVKVEAKGDGAEAIELEIQKIINDIQE